MTQERLKEDYVKSVASVGARLSDKTLAAVSGDMQAQLSRFAELESEIAKLARERDDLLSFIIGVSRQTSELVKVYRGI